MHDHRTLASRDQRCAFLEVKLYAQRLLSSDSFSEFCSQTLSYWVLSFSPGSYPTVGRQMLAYLSTEIFNACAIHSLLMSLTLSLPQVKSEHLQYACIATFQA
eukprot:2944802-Amphidinium_carterae.2